MIYVLVLWVCVCIALPAQAQETEDGTLLIDTMPLIPRPKVAQFLELGVSANAYNGDLSGYEKWTACYHFAVRFNEAKRWNGRLGASFGFLTGDNRFYKFAGGEPNNFFRTPVFTVSYEAHYNIIKKRAFQLYLSAGLGLLQYEPKDEKGNRYHDSFATRAPDETYSTISFMLPVGVGASYILKNGYGVGVQAQLLNIQTDYIDNISQWGKKTGSDNIASIRLFVYAPLKFLKSTIPALPTKSKRDYTHEILK